MTELKITISGGTEYERKRVFDALSDYVRLWESQNNGTVWRTSGVVFHPVEEYIALPENKRLVFTQELPD